MGLETVFLRLGSGWCRCTLSFFREFLSQCRIHCIIILATFNSSFHPFLASCCGAVVRFFSLFSSPHFSPHFSPEKALKAEEGRTERPQILFAQLQLAHLLRLASAPTLPPLPSLSSPSPSSQTPKTLC
jgi:hypothetical protein